ncbi:MAG TPA: T9SS type A sorting domain-containing protein [Candidatus Cloacimonetes bacterium]|nr:T9SS type A sorting domain-containing protein [Candidatus Cloacimonadota bacterium]
MIIPVAVDDKTITNSENQLFRNFPNPFRNNTEISFSLNENITDAKLTIYNIKGQKVRVLECFNSFETKATESLSHITWNGKDENGSPVAAGIYFYQLQTDDFSAMKKMILLR